MFSFSGWFVGCPVSEPLEFLEVVLLDVLLDGGEGARPSNFGPHEKDLQGKDEVIQAVKLCPTQPGELELEPQNSWDFSGMVFR